MRKTLSWSITLSVGLAVVWFLVVSSNDRLPSVETRCEEIVRRSEATLEWNGAELHGTPSAVPRHTGVTEVDVLDVPRYEGAWIRVTGIFHLEAGGPSASPSGFTYTLLRSPVTSASPPIDDRLFLDLATLPGDWQERLPAIDDRCVVVKGFVRESGHSVVARIISPVTGLRVWDHPRIPLKLIPLYGESFLPSEIR